MNMRTYELVDLNTLYVINLSCYDPILGGLGQCYDLVVSRPNTSNHKIAIIHYKKTLFAVLFFIILLLFNHYVIENSKMFKTKRVIVALHYIK